MPNNSIQTPRSKHRKAMRNTLRLTLLTLWTLGYNVRAFGSGESTKESSATQNPADFPHILDSVTPLHTSIRQEINQAETIASAASNSMELIDAWQGALQTAQRITQAAKNRNIESFGKDDRDIKTLNESAAWGYLTFYGEGQHPRFELQLDYWTGLANKLPDNHAKAFFELAHIAYDNASFSGWSHIQQRTWDYGGCSPFGTDLHLTILSKIDAIRADPGFASRVDAILARIRELTMTDLLSGTAEFPYCNKNKPEQQKKMLTEARAILRTIGLSEAERTALQARVDTNMGL